MTTLLRALQDATGLSRRKAFAAIREGHVTLNGARATEPSSEFETGDLRLDGVRLKTQGPPPRVYLMLNKPVGYITTASDEYDRHTVLELIPDSLRATGLHAVGRLDLDTCGLLLLTNDGDLTFRLTHPSHEIEKEYWIATLEPLDQQQFGQLRRGIELDQAVRRPVRLERLEQHEGGIFSLAMTIREGRNRQVRRMVDAVDARVTALRRVREGPLRLGSLPEGAVRPLTDSEVRALRG
jgi:23S rRNA pseudouridine2605 synthase